MLVFNSPGEVRDIFHDGKTFFLLTTSVSSGASGSISSVRCSNAVWKFTGEEFVRQCSGRSDCGPSFHRFFDGGDDPSYAVRGTCAPVAFAIYEDGNFKRLRKLVELSLRQPPWPMSHIVSCHDYIATVVEGQYQYSLGRQDMASVIRLLASETTADQYLQAGQGNIFVMNRITKKAKFLKLTSHYHRSCLRFSKDGMTLAVASDNNYGGDFRFRLIDMDEH